MKFMSESPPTCFNVLGPIITFKGFAAKESIGNLIDIMKTHKRGNRAIKDHSIIEIPTINFKLNDKLNNLLSINSSSLSVL